MNEEEIIVSIDAMGGDNAPFSAIKACDLVSAKDNLRLILVGDEDVIGKQIRKDKYPFVDICNTDKHIRMDDKVNLQMLKSRDNSMCFAISLLKAGNSHYALSAGNTAAFVSYAISELGLIKNIERPLIAILIPNVNGTFTVFADAGANANTKPFHILQAAQMSSLFASNVFGIKKPKVALLNIGSEQGKGDELRKAAFDLLDKKSDVNFMGNIEGQDLFSGKADVVITDGFTGNVVLKVTEGITRSFKTMLLKEIRRSMLGKMSGLLLKKTFKNFAKRIDYAEYGGGILLGVNGVVVISHGRSSPRAIHSAIKFGKRVVVSDLLANLKKIAEKN
ncbi:MAG TPA: phosphate acyltransferase PlsX [bacterium]|nr:phosphate acyltransferase PlsX [bacterium]